MNCAQQAQLVALISAVFISINIITFVSFYGWRRARAPWRAVLFTIFILCALLVCDFFVYAIVPQSVAVSGPVCK